MNLEKEIGKRGFKCGAFEIEPSRNLLIHNRQTYSVEPRIMDVLCVLAERAGDVLTRDELIDKIWRVEFGADESLTRAISILRKTFKNAGVKEKYIETFPKRGYRLAQPVIFYTDDTTKVALEKRPAPIVSSSANESIEKPFARADSNFETAQKPNGESITRKKKSKNSLTIVAVILPAFVLALSALYFLRAPANKIKTHIHEQSIAVMPFEDYSPTKDQGYFANGIAEELLNVLTRMDGLRVASRTSSFSYKASNIKASTIGENLDVGHILEGSVRRIGGTVKISAQLIDTETDQHIWSRTYQRDLTPENIFSVQEDISRAIASELKLEMNISQAEEGPPTQSTEAYEAYLKGKALYAPRTKEAINAAIAELKRAVAIDPGFADAHATLARVYMMASEFGIIDPTTAFSQAGIHLETAIDLAPNSSESLTAKAQVLFQQRQFLIAFEYFNVATVSDPLDPVAWRGKGLSLRELGQLDDAKTAFEQALQINPLSSTTHLNLSNIEMYREDLDAAISNVENALVLDANNVAAHEQLSLLTLSKADYAEAHRLFKQNIAKFPRISNHLQRLYYLIGRPDLETSTIDWYNRSYLAFNAGDSAKAVQLALDPKNSGPYAQKAEVLYNAGNLNDAYATVKKDKVQMEIFSRPTPIGAYNEEIAILYYKILSAKSDPASVILYDKLSSRFEGKGPSDFRLPSSLQSGAAWQLVNNNSSAMSVWLAKMNENGQLWRHIEFDPLFDSLRETKEFEQHWEKMEENAARYSDAIDAQ